MRKFLIFIVCLSLVLTCSVSAFAAGRKVVYLYRDFTPMFENEDGSVLYRYIPDLGSMFSNLHSVNQGHISNNFGSAIFFDGVTSDSYWANFYILGVYSSDVPDLSQAFNMFSLQGWTKGATLGIGYTFFNANIEADHHDVLIQYYDDKFNPTDLVQVQSPFTSTDSNRFLINVPIDFGDNPLNSYFTINVQIDDIVPASDGRVRLVFDTLVLSTTGSVTGGNLWDPIVPNRPNADGLSDVNKVDASIGEIAKQFFAGFDGLSSDFSSMMATYGDGIRLYAAMLSELVLIEPILVLITFSVVWGVIAMLYSLQDFSYKSSTRKQKKPKKKEGGIK